jgi:gluconolactonase
VAVKFDPKKSALIIQDLQNDVIIEGGAFADSGSPAHAKKQNVVANVKSLAAAARAAGMPVIHVWYIVEKGAPGLKLNAPLFAAVAASKALVRGTWGAAPAKGLEPKRGDHVVEKTRMNAFHGTNLDNLLRGLGTETLVITGAWTNFSIEHTARHAADSGYNAIVVTDGCSTVDDEWHNAGLNYALQNIAERVPTKDVLAVLKRGARRPAPLKKPAAGRPRPTARRS